MCWSPLQVDDRVLELYNQNGQKVRIVVWKGVYALKSAHVSVWCVILKGA